MLLYSEEEAKDLLRGFLDSKEYWTFLAMDRLDVLTDIEEAFYSGEANVDFHLTMGAYIPGGAVAFAKKDRMSKAELEGILQFDILDRDIMQFGTEGEMEQQISATLLFAQWLGYSS